MKNVWLWKQEFLQRWIILAECFPSFLRYQLCRIFFFILSLYRRQAISVIYTYIYSIYIFCVFWIAPISAHGTWLMNEYTHRTFSHTHTHTYIVSDTTDMPFLNCVFQYAQCWRKNIDDNWQNSKSTARFVAETVCSHFFFSLAFGDDSQWTANTDHRPFFYAYIGMVFLFVFVTQWFLLNAYWNSKMVFFFRYWFKVSNILFSFLAISLYRISLFSLFFLPSANQDAVDKVDFRFDKMYKNYIEISIKPL